MTIDLRAVTALCAVAAVVGSGGRVSAASPDDLAGYQTTFSAQTEDPAPGRGPMTLTATVTIVSASASELRMRYGTLGRHADGATARRVASDVVVPLPSVTIDRSDSSIRFSCKGGANCISWTHTDFYSDDGASFGAAGTSQTYGILLAPEAIAKLSASLCHLAACN